MHAVTQDTAPHVAELLRQAARSADGSGVFAQVVEEPGRIACQSKIQPDAWYRIETDGGRLTANWVSEDRYLSQSIEAELMWTGDDLDDMIDEERVDLGFDRGPLGKLEHYRNPEKMFTFRASIPIEMSEAEPERDAPELVKCLLAFEAAFRELGDMKPEED